MLYVVVVTCKLSQPCPLLATTAFVYCQLWANTARTPKILDLDLDASPSPRCEILAGWEAAQRYRCCTCSGPCAQERSCRRLKTGLLNVRYRPSRHVVLLARAASPIVTCITWMLLVSGLARHCIHPNCLPATRLAYNRSRGAYLQQLSQCTGF